MDSEKRNEVKQHMIMLIGNFEYESDLLREIESGYIFGTYADNEHYSIDELQDILNEAKNENV